MSAREVPELTHSQPRYAEEYLKHYNAFPLLRSKNAGPRIQDGSLSGGAATILIADDDQSARSVISEDDAAEILRKTMLEAGKAYLSRAPVEVEVTIEDTLAEK